APRAGRRSARTPRAAARTARPRAAHVTPSLDVAIVSYRCPELPRQCLLSLRAHAPRRPMAIHVVDNDSRDGTAELVRDEFPEVRLVAETTNVGFAAATNSVIRETTGDYVLALNPDTQ